MNLSQATQTFQKTLAGYDGFWCVAGGWAIDLFLNRQTREHEDLEIVVLRDNPEQLYQHFKKFNPQKIFSGDPPEFIKWNGEPIESDVIQIRLDPVDSSEFDLLLSPSENGEWICRRDESIRRPFSEASFISQSGLPVLAPEIVLLFKAKYLRDKDLSDYRNTLPSLSTEQRERLDASLKQIHPGHPWLL